MKERTLIIGEKMQFIVLGYDGPEDGAIERRMAARDAHLKMAKELFDAGKWLFAAAILNDAGRMIGSMIVCDFPTQNALQEEWLHREPYITQNVWKHIEVNRAQVASFCIEKK